MTVTSIKRASRRAAGCFSILGLLFFALVSSAQDAPPEEQLPLEDQIQWVPGPAVGDMQGVAEINVAEGYVFANKADTQLLMQAMGNLTSDEEIGFFAPESLDWFILFEFSDVGYVKDDEKDDLDATAMLDSIRAGTEESNKIRQERGFGTLSIVGWEQEPRYNEQTHNMEWAIRAQDSDGSYIVNHNTRVLGRRGIAKVTLVVDPESLAATLPVFREHMAEFTFKAGEKYEEFNEGDKIAKYGLTGLVVGGAAAVAAKSGLFKYLWKFLVVGAVACGAFFKRFFGGKSDENA